MAITCPVEPGIITSREDDESTELVVLLSKLVAPVTLRRAFRCVLVWNVMYHNRPQDNRIVKTISVRRSDLEAVTYLLRQLLGHDDADQANVGKSHLNDGSLISPRVLLDFARNILVARRGRLEFFNRAMFGEPAWDMLLALYIGEVEGPRHSISGLSSLSGAPATTALRWLHYLDKEQLVVRYPNPTDRRSDFVELTDKGRTMMERYLSGTIQTVE